MKRTILKKIAVLILILAMIAAFRFFHLGQYLTLAHIKESRQEYVVLYKEHKSLVIAGYMVMYILATSLSLPGAVVLTIAGGALFGLATGTIVVSFASTIGATLACVVSRFLLRNWVEKKFADKIGRVNEGIQQEGGFYLFTLRLIPVFPFWLINLVMGVTKMRLFTFYWISQVGMLPATVMYVNAGKELAQLDSLKGIISPELLGSFALLGIFPLAAKRIIALYKKRKGSSRPHNGYT
ncbi:MAG TPA: TVP38/TMEM64 family protein [Thermodesulfovibrionales bacterium]|nr:TVP38/TMEM64 family protein [Thermodesulfovibrionales bacterium]